MESNTFYGSCTTLNNQGITLDQIDFSNEPFGFLKYLRVFFLTLFDGVNGINFWQRVYLKVFYENVHSEGKSYCFVAYQESNEPFQDSGTNQEKQYEKNIRRLTRLLNNARKNSQSQPTIIKNKSEVK